MDRFWALGMLLVPPTCATMQFHRTLGRLIGQVRAQHIAKEVVIAIPVVLAIEGREKEICAIELFQYQAAI